MATAHIYPSTLFGNITASASKSCMQRACAAAFIRKGETILFNPGDSNDDKAALAIIEQLGASIEKNKDSIIIRSEGIHYYTQQNQTPFTIDCGESGLSLRMFAPIVALFSKPITLVGSGSLINRPMDFFDTVFPLLGIQVLSNNGKLPITIQGPMQHNNITIDGSLSSQFLTGLLMAYAAFDAKEATIHVHNLNSKPYIDLTLEVMQTFALKTPTHNNYSSFYFSENATVSNSLKTIEYFVEGDWSGAAFLLVAGAIAGNITVHGLNNHSVQADKLILQALRDAGVNMRIEHNDIHVKSGLLRAFQFDATDCPDLFPPLVALATYCKGTTTIKGVERLLHKESNRALALKSEFKKMGVEIIIEENNMHIIGGGVIMGGTLDSHHDHRIAMACTIAALKATTKSTIEHAEAIHKSYPRFYKDVKELGGRIEY